MFFSLLQVTVVKKNVKHIQYFRLFTIYHTQITDDCLAYSVHQGSLAWTWAVRC